MSDELFISGKTYVSSRRASEISGYAQDYIGQLCRGGLIDAQRVGGLWYVFLDSLNAYEKNTEAARPQILSASAPHDPEALVNFDGKDYISASRASKLTGYNQDYIGQLARASKILSRQIGNRWYVEREGLLAHKSEKDGLLANVQSESVGLKRPEPVSPEKPHVGLTYHSESNDLLPVIAPKAPIEGMETDIPTAVRPTMIPIRVVNTPLARQNAALSSVLSRNTKTKSKLPSIAAGAVAALTVILVLSYGVGSLKDGSLYAKGNTATTTAGYTAAAASIVDGIAEKLEELLTDELYFERRY